LEIKKAGFFAFILCVYTMVAYADNYDVQIQLLDREIATLTAEKQKQYAGLENCAKKVTGFKIAGISLIGLTAGGVVWNVSQSRTIATQRDNLSKQECEKSIPADAEPGWYECVPDDKNKGKYKRNLTPTGETGYAKRDADEKAAADAAAKADCERQFGQNNCEKYNAGNWVESDAAKDKRLEKECKEQHGRDCTKQDNEWKPVELVVQEEKPQIAENNPGTVKPETTKSAETKGTTAPPQPRNPPVPAKKADDKKPVAPATQKPNFNLIYFAPVGEELFAPRPAKQMLIDIENTIKNRGENYIVLIDNESRMPVAVGEIRSILHWIDSPRFSFPNLPKGYNHLVNNHQLKEHLAASNKVNVYLFVTCGAYHNHIKYHNTLQDFKNNFGRQLGSFTMYGNFEGTGWPCTPVRDWHVIQ